MEMQKAQSILPRVLGTVRLDVPTIEAIDRDRDATVQAVIVVAVVGIANGIAVAMTEEIGLLGLFTATIGNFLGWLVFAGVAYFIGIGLLPGEATEAETTRGGVFRTVGYAQAPNILGIAALAGILGLLVSFFGFIWVVVCGIVALKVALRVSTARAIATGIIAGFVTILATGLFLSLVEAMLV